MANSHPFESVEAFRQAGINTFEDVIRMMAEMAFKEGDLPPPIADNFPAKGKAYRDLTNEEWAELRLVAVERHFALNWFCGYAPGNNWDSTPTET